MRLTDGVQVGEHDYAFWLVNEEEQLVRCFRTCGNNRVDALNQAVAYLWRNYTLIKDERNRLQNELPDCD